MKRILRWLVLGALLLSLCGCGAYLKGEMKLSMKKYDEAIALFNEHLAKNPDSIIARRQLGYAYLQNKQYAEAIAAFHKVLEAEQDDPFAVLHLGMAYIEKKDLTNAIATWKNYKDASRPMVEEEVKRLLTILTIANSQQSAKKALAQEAKIGASKVDLKAVAVTYFQDDTPDKSMRAFQKALAAMVITDLSKIQSLKVVERMRLQALLQEMKLGQTGIVDQKTAPRVGRLLGAETLLVGSLSKGSIKAYTSVTSTSKGDVAGTSAITVDEKNFFELPIAIVRQTAKVMGITLTPEEEKAIGVPHTKSLKAFTYFGQALDALDAGEWAKALAFFQKALREDPKFGLAGSGNASSPGTDAPSMATLAAMTTAEVSALAATTVSESLAAQAAADAAAAATCKGSGGGSGH